MYAWWIYSFQSYDLKGTKNEILGPESNSQLILWKVRRYDINTVISILFFAICATKVKYSLLLLLSDM